MQKVFQDESFSASLCLAGNIFKTLTLISRSRLMCFFFFAHYSKLNVFLNNPLNQINQILTPSPHCYKRNQKQCIKLIISCISLNILHSVASWANLSLNKKRGTQYKYSYQHDFLHCSNHQAVFCYIINHFLPYTLSNWTSYFIRNMRALHLTFINWWKKKINYTIYVTDKT